MLKHRKTIKVLAIAVFAALGLWLINLFGSVGQAALVQTLIVAGLILAYLRIDYYIERESAQLAMGMRSVAFKSRDFLSDWLHRPTTQWIGILFGSFFLGWLVFALSGESFAEYEWAGPSGVVTLTLTFAIPFIFLAVPSLRPR
jgi:hypothetical protein